MKSEDDIRDRLDAIPDGDRYELFGAGYVAALEWVLNEGETAFGERLDDGSEEPIESDEDSKSAADRLDGFGMFEDDEEFLDGVESAFDDPDGEN